MRAITEDQDRIGWANFVEDRIIKRIRDMQTMYMCNRGSTCTEDHWSRELIRKLMELTHEQWLKHNLTKHHRNDGSIALKTK